jgi:hypothetical protein
MVLRFWEEVNNHVVPAKGDPYPPMLVIERG